MNRAFVPACLILSLATAAGGCGDDGNPADGGIHDLSASGDLHTPMPGDLSAADLAQTPDLVPPTPSGQLGNVRLAADSASPDGGALAIDVFDVYVTYIRTDIAGFYVQAEKLGPAVFVAVDPATLTPSPVVGDKVSFTVTGVAKLATLRMVTSLTGWQRTAQGFDVSTLVQNLSSAADLVTAIDTYDSELVTVAGTFSGPFGSSGTGFVQAQLDTAAVTGNTNLKARIASTVMAAADLAQGCSATIGPTPLGRFGSPSATTVQPSAYQASELVVSSCPAPRVVRAAATSATSLLVTFDRNINSSSITASGAQFTFDNGLTASAAAPATARTVTVTTSAQTPGTTYNLTVASSIVDTYASALDAAHNTASFTGYKAPAQLQINEVNPAISGGLDLVELRAVTAGSTTGMVLQQSITIGASPTVIATLPALDLQAGDLIVVHVNPPAGVTDETSSKTSCTDAACYAGAYDLRGVTIGTSGLANAYRVLVIKNALDAIIDGVPYYNGGEPSVWPTEVKALQDAGQWLPATCGSAPCNDTSVPTIATITVSLANIGTSATGKSLQRLANADTNQVADWTVANATFGASN